VDEAESAKEAAAARRLETFMARHLAENHEEAGVHYSDLFEQYLPVKDKPRRLLDESQAFAEVAAEALGLCHFDLQSEADLRRAPGAKEDCEAACYNCLLSYYNQMDHRLLDRQSIKEILFILTRSTAHSSPQVISRAEHLQRLCNLCQSDLECGWLDYIVTHNYNLPSRAQKLVGACHTHRIFCTRRIARRSMWMVTITCSRNAASGIVCKRSAWKTWVTQ